MTVSQFSATFYIGWSEEVLTCAWNPSEPPRPETHIKPDVSHATQAHWRTSISRAIAVKRTASVQTDRHSLFFLILPISATKPTDSFSPQNPSPSPSSLYLPIWMPLMLNSGKWGPWLSIVMLYFDNEVESTLFWNLDFTFKFLKTWFLIIWMFKNVVIHMFGFIRNILRYLRTWDDNVWFILRNLKWIIYFFHSILIIEGKLPSS